MEIMIGVSKPEVDLFNYFTNFDGGWGFYLSCGKAYHSGEGFPFLIKKVHVGDVIRVSVNWGAG